MEKLARKWDSPVKRGVFHGFSQGITASLEAGENAVGNGLVVILGPRCWCMSSSSPLSPLRLSLLLFMPVCARMYPHMPDATWRTRG